VSDGEVQGQVYLRAYLAPLVPLLDQADVTDLYVNRPGEVWIERLGGGIERHDVAELTPDLLGRLARQIAAFSHQGVNREHPILSAALPGGERIQIVLPPATRGEIALAIRKSVSADLSLNDYQAAGAFDAVRRGGGPRTGDLDARLKARLDAGDVAGLLREAVQGRRNILVSGGTSTGKTTFLNALIQEIPREERLIFIEDTPELKLRHPNAVGLLAARSALGEAAVTAEDLLAASLRMRPDRIILGELRGPEAYTFLRSVNTGHPGSMTTIHADSPGRAVEQLALLVLQGGTQLSRSDVLHYVRASIDVFVQLSRRHGRRTVTEIQLKEPSE
jgi:type IV secretion system protein VirB11